MRPSLQEKKPQPFDWGKHLENLPDRNVANHLATLRNKSASSLFQRHAVALRLELIVQAQANRMECRIKVVGMKPSEPRRTEETLAAQIDVLIFHLRGPISTELMLQTTSDDKSDLRTIPSLKGAGCGRRA